MKKTYFIIGTDTEIGKTYVSVKLLNQLNQLGFRTIGLKPLATGGIKTSQGLRNDDALKLQKAASLKLPYKMINPFIFEPPIAPHLAAKKIGKLIRAIDLIQHCQNVISHFDHDYTLIEGIGGWLTPLNNNEALADWVANLNVPVILVIGIKLGCLNHSLLTWQSLQVHKITVAGWIANCIDPNVLAEQENIETLKHWIKVPFLAKIPYHEIESTTTQILI